jgi:hypothetical protein
MWENYFKTKEIDFKKLEDYKNEEGLFEIWDLARTEECINLVSGKGTYYPFGPAEIIYPFEYFIKNLNYKTFHLELQMSHDEIINCGTSALMMNLINFCYKKTSEIFNFIPKNEKINLFARPKTWLYLLKNDHFIEDLNKYKENIYSLISTDYPALFPKDKIPEPIFLNDNCIDWRTGVNFYTCKYKNKHSVPCYLETQKGICNLLNLGKNKLIGPEVDYIEITEKKCECGKKICFFKSRYIEDPCEKIINKLNDNYLNLQFHFKENEVDIYYIKPNKEKISEKDKEIILDQYKQCNFVENGLFSSGRKCPTWWFENMSEISTCTIK